MKKLSFIMAVIMIVMTFPMMFMSSASATDVAADADAPATIESTDNVLHTYATDAEAVANNCIGRFTKAGGNGYVKTWKEISDNTGKAAIDKLTTLYLITNLAIDDAVSGTDATKNNAIGRGTRTIDFTNGNLTVDGSLGNYKIYAKNGTDRLIHFGVTNDQPYATGTITFKGIRFETNQTGSCFQTDNGNTIALAFENCTITCPKAGQIFCVRNSGGLFFKNCTITGRNDADSNGNYLFHVDAASGTKVIVENCDLTASRGVNLSKSNQVIEFTNCKININSPKSTGGLIQTSAAEGISGNKITVKNCTVDCSYGFVTRYNMDVTLENCNFTVKNNLIHVDNKAVTNSVFNINGGVYTSTKGKIVNSQSTTGTTYNFYDGTFVTYNLKDEPVAKANGESVGTSGMFYLSNCKALNIYGGSYTLYKDHGVTLCEKSPIILGWATGGVNTTVYGGKFTGGSCFFAKVKNDSNAKFDEAGSVFYGYGEGKNTINIAPEVVKGASIRLDAKSGLRFTSTIAANTINYLNAALVKAETELTYGTVITRASYLKYTGGVFTMEAFDKAGKNYVNVVAKDGVAKNADGSVTINAALVDIDAANYDKDFVAISYVKYTNANDEEVYLYATNVSLAENARNMEEVALAALADVKTKAEGAYTNAVSEYYVYNVAARKYELYTGTAYSVYTADQIKALQSYIVVEE